jgi:hypothetical protein
MSAMRNIIEEVCFVIKVIAIIGFLSTFFV